MLNIPLGESPMLLNLLRMLRKDSVVARRKNNVLAAFLPILLHAHPHQHSDRCLLHPLRLRTMNFCVSSSSSTGRNEQRELSVNSRMPLHRLLQRGNTRLLSLLMLLEILLLLLGLLLLLLLGSLLSMLLQYLLWMARLLVHLLLLQVPMELRTSTPVMIWRILLQMSLHPTPLIPLLLCLVPLLNPPLQSPLANSQTWLAMQ